MVSIQSPTARRQSLLIYEIFQVVETFLALAMPVWVWFCMSHLITSYFSVETGKLITSDVPIIPTLELGGYFLKTEQRSSIVANI